MTTATGAAVTLLSSEELPAEELPDGVQSAAELAEIARKRRRRRRFRYPTISVDYLDELAKHHRRRLAAAVRVRNARYLPPSRRRAEWDYQWDCDSQYYYRRGKLIRKHSRIRRYADADDYADYYGYGYDYDELDAEWALDRIWLHYLLDSAPELLPAGVKAGV